MAIKVYEDYIQFGSTRISTTADGISLDKRLRAHNLIHGFQGTVAGFVSAGAVGVSHQSTIDKFPFAIDVDATDVGDTNRIGVRVAGQSSNDYGYLSGQSPSPTSASYVDRFLFSISGGTGTNVGSLSQTRTSVAGQSSSTDGYTSGGFRPSSTYYNTVDKFPFSSDFTTATDVGNITLSRRWSVGQSSTTHGYTSGGVYQNPGLVSTSQIDKFPFAADFTLASQVGALTEALYQTAGQSSTTDGYTSGGNTTTSPYRDTIDKFPFSTDSNATDLGDLSLPRMQAAGQSSTTHGYSSGGFYNPYPNANLDIIEKFPFSSGFTTATDVGDLTQGRYGSAGQQY